MNTSLEVVFLYAAVFGIIHFAITIRIGLIRARTRVSLGDGGDKGFLKLIRGQQNFAENVPIALILCTLVGLQGASVMVMHILLLLLLVGRVSHYLQITGALKPIVFRMGGMILTFLSMLIASACLLLNLS